MSNPKPVICFECAVDFKAHFDTPPLETSSEWRAKFLKGEQVTCELCQIPQSMWKPEMDGWPKGKSVPEVSESLSDEKKEEYGNIGRNLVREAWAKVKREMKAERKGK